MLCRLCLRCLMGNLRSKVGHGLGRMPTDVLHFHYAVMCNDPQAVQEFIINKVDIDAPWRNPDYPTMKDGSTPLICAVSLNFVEIVEILIAAGADVNKSDFRGCSPLFKAAMHGRTNLIETLMKAGAEVDAAAVDGITPLNICVRDFVVHNQESAVVALIEHGANIKSRDVRGNTPLHSAAHGKSHKMVELLLKEGCDPNWTDHKGRTPLYLCMSTLSSCLYREDLKIQLPTIKILFYAGSDMLNAMEWILWKGRGIPEDMFDDPDDPFLEWYVENLDVPMTLRNSCRKCIQRILLQNGHSKLPFVVQTFNLPRTLQEFVGRKMCHGMDQSFMEFKL